MWTVWNDNNQTLFWKMAWKQANKAVESQLPVYITQAISRLSNVCYMRVRVSKWGQLAYTVWGLLCAASVVYAFCNSTKFKTGIRNPMVKTKLSKLSLCLIQNDTMKTYNVTEIQLNAFLTPGTKWRWVVRTSMDALENRGSFVPAKYRSVIPE